MTLETTNSDCCTRTPTNPILSFDFNTFMERGSMMSREHVLLRLAKEYLILHSTPPAGRHITPPDGGLKKVAENLYHYTNPRLLPRLYHPEYLVSLTDRLRSLHRQRVLTKLGATAKPILYIWHPAFAQEIDRYDHALSIYHIYDDYPTLNGIHPDLELKEISLLEKSDIVFVTNKSLIAKKRALVDRDYIHLSQAVDFDFFSNARNDKTHPPDDISRIPNPRLGYIGRVNEKVDLNLIIELSQRRKDWSFVFIGPINSTPALSSSLERLEKSPNVHFLGTKDFSEIASYWSSIDVAIVPYRVEQGQWAHFGSPLKLRESFAAGKPVVSTPLNDIQDVQNLALTASSPAEWEKQIEAALDQRTNSDLNRQMIDFARSNSWTARTDFISRMIRDQVSQR